MSEQRFEATVALRERGHIFIALPFDPKEVWGKQKRYYVKGMVNGCPFRGSLGVRQGSYFMPINKELQQQAGITVGQVIEVVMEEEVAQMEEVPEDLVRALGSEPQASSFFDTLTAFYRNQYIQWIEEAKKPE